MVFRKPEISPTPRNTRLDALLAPFQIDASANLLKGIEAALTQSIQSGKTSNKSLHIPEIRVADTCLTQFPTQKESGSFYALCIKPTEITASLVTFADGAFRQTLERASDFTDSSSGQRVCLTSRKFAATTLVTAAVDAVRLLLKEYPSNNGPAEFVIAVSHPIDQSAIRAATLLLLEADMMNDDPISNADITGLLNIGFQRADVNAVAVGILSDACATLLAGSYQVPKSQARCLMSLVVGETIAASYMQPNAREFGFSGAVVDVDVSHFNGNKLGGVESNFSTLLGLPFSEVDYEVDYAMNRALVGTRCLERMVTGTHLPELVRHLLLAAYQQDAPEALWKDHSLPLKACMAVSADSDNAILTQVLTRYWNWTPPQSEHQFIRSVFEGVVNRAAMIVAVIICAVTRKTGRLQPALGGVTVGMADVLAMNSTFQVKVRNYLDNIFSRDTSQLILFFNVDEGAAKGAALLNYMVKYRTY